VLDIAGGSTRYWYNTTRISPRSQPGLRRSATELLHRPKNIRWGKAHLGRQEKAEFPTIELGIHPQN
jgi:hypothetical protein